MELQSPFIIGIYFFLEELTKALNSFAGFQGYAIVKQRTKKNSKTNEVFKVYFRCDRGGKSEDIEHGRKRKHAAIRLIDCPFSCFALNKVDVGWILILRDGSHNHESTSEGFHPALRKMVMTISIKTSIETQIKAQATFFQILTILRLQNADCILKKRDIYNEKAAICRKTLGPFSSMQFFVQNLDRVNWYLDYQTIIEFHKLTHLFFTEESTVDMLKNNSEVLLMDCTYKINKFKLPLLVIVGQIFMGSTFYAGFVFISKEQELDYV